MSEVGKTFFYMLPYLPLKYLSQMTYVMAIGNSQELTRGQTVCLRLITLVTYNSPAHGKNSIHTG